LRDRSGTPFPARAACAFAALSQCCRNSAARRRIRSSTSFPFCAASALLAAVCIAAASLVACTSQRWSSNPGPLPVTTSEKTQAGKSPAVQDENGKSVVCVYETPVGTHIPQKTCRFRGEVDQERQETQDKMRAVRNGGQRGN